MGQSLNSISSKNRASSFSDWTKTMMAALWRQPDQTIRIRSCFGLEPLLTSTDEASLYAILKSFALPRGAGVAVPLFCSQTVFEAIRQADLKPIFIDIEENGFNICAKDLDRKKHLSSAVIAVHMFGHPADMDAVNAVAGDRPVVEDCTHSFYSRYKNQLTGFLADASFFSFRSGNYLSAVSGSVIFCRSESIHREIQRIINSFSRMGAAEQILHYSARAIKSTLWKRSFSHPPGYQRSGLMKQKSNRPTKTDFGFSKLPHRDLKLINGEIENMASKIRRQRENAYYLLDFLELDEDFLPYEKKDCFSNYHLFPIKFKTVEQRNEVFGYLLQKGIDTVKYLDGIAQIAKAHYGYEEDCPNAEKCSKRTLIIPHHDSLSKRDLSGIVDSLNDCKRIVKPRNGRLIHFRRTGRLCIVKSGAAKAEGV